jgi:hypothetical protein
MLVVFVLLMIWVLAKDRIRKMGIETGDKEIIASNGHLHKDAGDMGILESDRHMAKDRWGRLRRLRLLTTTLIMLLKNALAPCVEWMSRPFKYAIERIPADLRTPVAAASLLAVGTCLKINNSIWIQLGTIKGFTYPSTGNITTTYT